jgi:hypothetical protein
MVRYTNRSGNEEAEPEGCDRHTRNASVLLLFAHDLDWLDSHRAPGRDNRRGEGRDDEDEWRDDKCARVMNRDTLHQTRHHS